MRLGSRLALGWLGGLVLWAVACTNVAGLNALKFDEEGSGAARG